MSQITIPIYDHADGELKEYSFGERKILVCRKGERYFATAATCPHSGAPLCQGKLNLKGYIVCPLHGYTFDPANGYNASGEGYKLKTYPSQLENNLLIINIPNP